MAQKRKERTGQSETVALVPSDRIHTISVDDTEWGGGFSGGNASKPGVKKGKGSITMYWRRKDWERLEREA